MAVTVGVNQVHVVEKVNVGEDCDEFQIVGCGDDGFVRFEACHAIAAGIERGGWFVEQEHFGIEDEDRRQRRLCAGDVLHFSKRHAPEGGGGAIKCGARGRAQVAVRNVHIAAGGFFWRTPGTAATLPFHGHSSKTPSLPACRAGLARYCARPPRDRIPPPRRGPFW